MARTRLTTRIAALKSRKAESQKDGLFPGDVGNMERSKNYHDIDEYHTFEQTINHELPDMRHEWKDNPREETGHGIPKMAKVYMAAKKATKLAMIMLGEDADEQTITAQARDFMRMGGNALTATINRWAEAEELKNADGEDADEAETEPDTTTAACDECAEEDDKTACEKEETACEKEETAGADDVYADDDVTAEKDEVVAEDENVETVDDTEDDAAEDTADSENVETADESEEDIKVDDGMIPAEIEFDEAAEGDVEADPELEDVFTEVEEGEENEIAPAEGAPVARKAGIKRLAAQPKLVRVAAKKGADELAGVWSKWESPELR